MQKKKTGNKIFFRMKKIAISLILIVTLCTIINFAISAQEREQIDEKPTAVEDPEIVCLEEGKNFFWQQQYSDAIKQLESCIEKDPDNPEIYYYIAQSYFQRGQRSTLRAVRYFKQAYEYSDIAIEKYYQAIAENPEEDNTNRYLQLAYIHQIRSLIPGVDEYQKALDIYQQLIEEKPFISSPYYHMGWIYFQQEEYQKGIEAFLDYLKPGLKSDFVYYHLALSYDKIGEREKSEYYYQLLLEEFPDSDLASRAQKELN
ncbi:MAG: tetratricopeptide repeat protein [Atribacterota bacterium]|nr:tetratricopeptide repeat protein [Atribacterota bacterium]